MVIGRGWWQLQVLWLVLRSIGGDSEWAGLTSRAGGDERLRDGNVTLTVAFTSDLHGEIGALKEAFAHVRRLSPPTLLVDAGDAFVGTSYFGRAGPAGMWWSISSGQEAART